MQNTQTVNWLAIVLFLAYTAVMIALSVVGGRRTKSVKSFATGNGSMGIGVVALSLASSFTSAATLMSMPGYVYQAGLAGIVYFNIFQTVGLLVGILVVGRKIRREGGENYASSVPEWLRKHYGSKAIGWIFAIQSIFLTTFMVLIVVLMGNLFQTVLHVDYAVAVIGVCVFVFAYSLLGGSYTHGWSGLVQSLIMIGVVVWLVIAMWPAPGAWSAFKTAVVQEDPYYFSFFCNPNGVIFKTPYEVVYCAFLLGFCNVFQPHIFNKALFLKKEKSWTLTCVVAFVVMSIFNLILLTGMFIRAKEPGLTQLDTIFVGYVANIMGTVAVALLFLTLMAAAMSTLNGVIIGMCSNLGSEVVPQSFDEKKSLRTVRLIVAAVGVAVIAFALKPPQFLLVIGMWGYNVLMSSALIPMICSLWFKRVHACSAIAATLTSIVLFVVILTAGITINGAVACGITVPASAVVCALTEWIARKREAA